MRPHRAVIAPVALMAALLLAACSGGGDGGVATDAGAAPPAASVTPAAEATVAATLSPNIRPIDEILDGPIRIEATDVSAVLRVDTTIDVMCTVVYGTDTTYGSISTDPDMGGAAHADHFAPLRGLPPDTVIHYRVQGTAADGTVYVGEDMTFRTAPAAAASSTADEPQNLASAAAGASVVEVSSAYANSPSWAGANAIDGDAGTEWSSDGDGDGAFITIQLAEPTQISRLGIWTRTMGATAQITRFQVVTESGVTLGPFDVPDAAGPHLYPVAVRAQTLRFEVVTSSGGNTGLVELIVYAEQ